MKTFLLVLALAMTRSLSMAQATVEVTLDQEQFLPSESVPVAVKITNRSGKPLHFGDDPAWLTFSVESADGFVVIKNSEVPVTGAFDLENSQMAIKRVDLQPHFVMMHPGRYKVIATVRIAEWATAISSKAKVFDVIRGADIWAQDFGVPNATNAVPEMRKYTLVQANYLKSQLRLYLQLSDEQEARIYHVTALGPLVSFSQPEAKVDRDGHLHALWQGGAMAFYYSVCDGEGKIVQQEIYDNFNRRPRLSVNEAGDVVVVGGVKRMKPGEEPATPYIQAPNELPAKQTQTRNF